MRDFAGRGGGFDPGSPLKALQAVPEPDASAEQDGDQHEVWSTSPAARNSRITVAPPPIAPGKKLGSRRPQGLTATLCLNGRLKFDHRSWRLA
jgi:hypothetical protein